MRVTIEEGVALIRQINKSGQNSTYRAFKEALKVQKNITGSDRDVFDLFKKSLEALSVCIVDNKQHNYDDVLKIVIEKTNSLSLDRVASLEMIINTQQNDIDGFIADKEELLEEIKVLNSKLDDLTQKHNSLINNYNELEKLNNNLTYCNQQLSLECDKYKFSVSLFTDKNVLNQIKDLTENIENLHKENTNLKVENALLKK
jgi:cell division protein FtsB